MSVTVKDGEDGKDHIIFVSKKDSGPPKINAFVPDDADGYEDEKSSFGPKLPDGSTNWDCPCLGGMAYGPCGPEFRVLMQHVVEEKKCDECVDQFLSCIVKYPELHPKKSRKSEDDDEDDDYTRELEEEERKGSSGKTGGASQKNIGAS